MPKKKTETAIEELTIRDKLTKLVLLIDRVNKFGFSEWDLEFINKLWSYGENPKFPITDKQIEELNRIYNLNKVRMIQ